ncbi:MAG: hypothetical protein ABJ327_00445 [Litoreibacter sp.]
MRKITDLESIYLERKSYDHDTFFFIHRDSPWSERAQAFASSEDIYDNSNVSDCDTPLVFFDKGFKFAFIKADMNVAYDDSWVFNGGEDNFHNFLRCLSSYIEKDTLVFPTLK